MNKITINNKCIYIDNDKIIFNFPIIATKELKNYILVLTKPDKDNIYNVYGINIFKRDKWVIESLVNKYPDRRSNFPYSGINLIEDNVIVTDFYGRRFSIDYKSGKFIGIESSVK